MGKTKDILKSEFVNGYTTFDKLFMGIMVLMQIIVFAITPDSPIAIIAGISGVISVVLCAKGKISFYFIGFIQTITYLILSWQNRFYGEVIENVFYLVTMVWGIFIWKKHLNTDDSGSTQVDALKFTPNQWIASSVLIIIATIVMGWMLTKIGSNQAYTDAATNVIAIFAQLLMVKRYREQWLFWIVIDVLCIKLWAVAGNWSMVAMYIGWTANCIYGWKNWSESVSYRNDEKLMVIREV